MDRLNRMKEILDLLNKASYAYYANDNPIMSDKQYDDLYDELSELENRTGIVLASSPTQKVQGYVLDKFNKVEHSKPMLSADKTKDINEIKKFLDTNKFYCSYKLDGLTLVVIFENGKFIKGITRGNGLIGEDVTEQCRFIKNLPMTIPYKDRLELRGECVISWNEFNRLNEILTEKYSHPRNLAAGTLRNLDLNIAKERNLSFVVFECVNDLNIDSKFETLIKLESFGFETVNRYMPKDNDIDSCIELMKPKNSRYPVDGLIFEIDSNEISKSMGVTSHHENCRMALKWADEEYETTLKDIEWNCGKSGQITPIAIFEPVKIDGTIIEKASVHNVSILKKLDLNIGDIIEVYKANMIIPQIKSNLSSKDRLAKFMITIPSCCPVCGKKTEIKQDNNSEILICTNPNCKGKLLGKLSHFVSKNAINIDGLSEQTLQKFIDLGWVKSFSDIYHLFGHKDEMYKLDGFGKKSVDKLLDNIQKSRNTELSRFIYSLSIPLIGRTASKDIAKVCCDDITVFLEMIKSNQLYKLVNEIDGFGDVMYKSLCDYMKLHMSDIETLSEEFMFAKREDNREANLSGKIFVITGSLCRYLNRSDLTNAIESMGGKVSGSVSSKTDFLICNDINSTSSKIQKAKKLGIPVITEEDFIDMIL